MSNPQKHSLNALGEADYTDQVAAKVNQGIVNNRPEGQEPPQAPVTLDTFVDEDASASPPRAADNLVGATSADVHDHVGHPGQGMSSKELRHDGRPGRKRYGEGVDQFGVCNWEGDGSRKLDGASERRYVASKADRS